MVSLSERFVSRLKLHERPAYKLAVEAQVNPTTLSKLLHGIERLKECDPRIVAVGQVLGLEAHECFEVEKQ